MERPSQNEIEVRWKGAQLVARGWPATLCVIGAIALVVAWIIAEGQGRLW
jgi:hypothetical protein